MPRRKPKEVKPEAQPTTSPTPPPTPQQIPAAYTIKEASWEEFEKFAPTPRRERPKSPLRQAYEMAAQGRVVKIEGLAPAQVRAVLAVVSIWNSIEKQASGKSPVQTKYDMKAGVVLIGD
jgi:hypothetical protein